MKIHSSVISILANALFSMNAHAQSNQGGELALYLGTPLGANKTLTFRKQGYPDITLDDVSFSTKAFDSPLYYGIRLGNWNEWHAWEVEHIHLNKYVDDLPAEVRHFEITDGYNLLLFNSAWQLEDYGAITRQGIGPDIADPQIIVRDLSTRQSGGGAIPTILDSDSGYQGDRPTNKAVLERELSIGKHRLLSVKGEWTGPAMKAALAREFSIGKHWLLNMEGKMTVNVLQSVRTASIISASSNALLSGRLVLSGRY